jgi:hypothetical protein
MVHNLVTDLCQHLEVGINEFLDVGGKRPTPITYLTQWKIVGNSEVHTLPYPDIPQGYTKCKYLEFHGTEYLNTGVKTNNAIGMSLTFSTTTESKAIIGARVSAGSNAFVFGILIDDTFLVGYGTNAKQMNAPVNALDGQLHTFTLSNAQCTLDNINVRFNLGTFSTPNANDIYIGTWNNNGTPDNRFYEGKIYSVRLYGSNVNLFNGIPCLDDNNVPCLYDTISGTTYYNDGTGTFGYEVEAQPTEIWSCGEYNATDGKYHILVQPQGCSIADIALTEPLRKVNDVTDTIDFPSDTEGKALVTRMLKSVDMSTQSLKDSSSIKAGMFLIRLIDRKYTYQSAVLSPIYTQINPQSSSVNAAKRLNSKECCYFYSSNPAYDMYASSLYFYDTDFIDASTEEIQTALQGVELIYELATPTTELVDAPQIAEAESYSMVISQGGKAVSWSSFETE